MRSIVGDGVPIPGDDDAERLYDREKGEDITDFWDIVQRKCIEKKSTGEKREGGIF